MKKKKGGGGCCCDCDMYMQQAVDAGSISSNCILLSLDSFVRSFVGDEIVCVCARFYLKRNQFE